MRESLGDRLLERGRPNSLNLVRLLLALLVVVSHAWALGGFGAGDPVLLGTRLGSWAVYGFFAVSGFLVAASRSRISATAFLRARGLRILPAYWVCLVVTAFLAAPAASALGDGRWSPGSALGYVARNLALWQVQLGVGSTLQGGGDPGVWNRSLWTLPFEALAYLGVLVALAPVLRRALRPLTVLLFVGSVGLYVLTAGGVTSTLLVRGPLLATFFTAGMVLFAWRDRVPVVWWLAVPSAGLALSGAFVGLVGTLTQPLGLAYVVLFLGAVVPPRWAQRHDVSYGVYVYAWPVTQLLLVVGLERAGAPVFVVAVTAVTTPLACASWLLVERPALRWKPARSRRQRDPRVRTGLPAGSGTGAPPGARTSAAGGGG